MADRKHVLLTTDLSEDSLATFPAARELVRALGARLTVLHVVQTVDAHPTTPFVPPIVPPSDEEVAEKARQDLERRRADFTGIDCEFVVEIAPVVHEAVVAYAEKHGVDYIAVATHGRRGLDRLVLGSVTEQILRHARVPCIVMPLRQRGS